MSVAPPKTNCPSRIEDCAGKPFYVRDACECINRHRQVDVIKNDLGGQRTWDQDKHFGCRHSLGSQSSKPFGHFGSR